MSWCVVLVVLVVFCFMGVGVFVDCCIVVVGVLWFDI